MRVNAQSPPVGMVWKFGEMVPSKLSSSLLDHPSSTNSPRIASMGKTVWLEIILLDRVVRLREGLGAVVRLCRQSLDAKKRFCAGVFAVQRF
ncbi:hypothetical protein TNCV_311301 [Trichonephila clavipes]|nr:hypothetical protein TNCV_311301 [Trichonephila clavipes]